MQNMNMGGGGGRGGQRKVKGKNTSGKAGDTAAMMRGKAMGAMMGGMMGGMMQTMGNDLNSADNPLVRALMGQEPPRNMGM